jgi:hypothetical protein
MSNAHLYVAVREASAGTFDVLGELGASANGGMVYLAREIAGDALVVLKLEPGEDGSGGRTYYLDVSHELDSSVPDVEMRCPRCRAKLRQWARFCTQCGLDVSGEAPASGAHASRAALREKVRAATAGEYDFLGDIPRSEGGGLVYFARDLSDGKIVALRLQKDMNKKFEVGVTRTLKAVEQEQALAADRAEAARPAVTIIQRSGAARIGGAVTPRSAPTPDLGVPGTPNAAKPNAPPNAPVARPERGLPARRWTLGRAEIAVALLIALIVILFLSRR